MSKIVRAPRVRKYCAPVILLDENQEKQLEQHSDTIEQNGVGAAGVGAARAAGDSPTRHPPPTTKPPSHTIRRARKPLGCSSLPLLILLLSGGGSDQPLTRAQKSRMRAGCDSRKAKLSKLVRRSAAPPVAAQICSFLLFVALFRPFLLFVSQSLLKIALSAKKAKKSKKRAIKSKD